MAAVPTPPSPLPQLCPYCLLPVTVYLLLGYPLPVTVIPLPSTHYPCHMSWPRFAARPNDNCLSRSACLSLPLSLSLHLLLLLCVFLSINALLLLLLLCCPPLTGTYNCLIVNVVVVILENIFLKIFLHIQFLFSFVIHKNSRAEQAPHDDDDTKRCSAEAYGGGRCAGEGVAEPLSCLLN